MRITDIRETAVPINSNMRNAVFDFSEMTTSVVAVLTDAVADGEPVTGYAFNSTGRYACGAVMRDRMIPRLRAAAPDTLFDDAGLVDPERAFAVMMAAEKPGGHTERSIAVGTIEVALWDAVAKAQGLPLYRLLADRFNGGRATARMPVYVGGGWYAPDKTVADLVAEMRGHLDAGYTRLKIKIGGAAPDEDRARIEAVLGLLDGDGARLAVDANCGFDAARAIAYARLLEPYGLAWYEEPCDPSDFLALAAVADAYACPLATGENLFSTQEVVNLARYGGLRPGRDFIHVDVPQSYGVGALARTLAALTDEGWAPSSVMPHGGNLMSLHIAAGMGLGVCESYPGVFGVFSDFADDTVVVDGHVAMPDRPGIGFEGQSALFAVMRELAA